MGKWCVRIIIHFNGLQVEADGDTINYLLYAGTGAYPKEDVYDTTSNQS